MANISHLPLANEPSGSETIAMVQNGQTRRGAIGALVSSLAAPHVAASTLALDQAADPVLPANIFIDVTLATAEAAVAIGTTFKIVETATGQATIYKRTGSGSTELYSEATTAALASSIGTKLVRGKLDAEAAKVRSQAEKNADFVNVLDFLDDSTSFTAALAAACAVSLVVRLPEGEFEVEGDGCPVRRGQIIIGAGSGGPTTGAKTRLFNNTPGGSIFYYGNDTSAATIKAPEFYDMALEADYPVRYNNETTAIIGDQPDDTNCPPLNRAVVMGCAFFARVYGTGRAISATRCFDSLFTQNYIVGFDTNILLWSCDINMVWNNRSLLAKSYHILDCGTHTHGSQNLIFHNDLLDMTSTAGTFVKSSGRHSRVIDNYLEHVPGRDNNAATVQGFIDFSPMGQPNFNGQGAGSSHTAIARDNRIDGMQHATDFIYRAKMEGRAYLEISDVGTTSGPRSAPGLVLVDAAGNNVDEFPVRFNGTNGTKLLIEGDIFDQWDGFRTTRKQSLTVDGTNIGQFGSEIMRNNAHLFLRQRHDGFIFKKGFDSVFELTDHRALEPSTKYYAEIVVEMVAGAETLRVGHCAGGISSALTDYALTTARTRIVRTFTTGAAGAGRNGLYFRRSNTGGGNSDIKFRQVRMFKAADVGNLATPGPRQPAVGSAAVSVAAPTKAEFDALVGKFNLLLARIGINGSGITEDEG
ncbi:MAG: hypothetical protein KKE77_13330 [Alphaproteobacteria bacterium]|uniref:Uncharacterized protein n=1 Tax=viral metagenome TaxID=1070528 RepID=A0A6M3XIH9_9ZZZZ|nr:hypothetical protein [Alphaproteobacteria bacterium]MBU2342209.1 hypothetical protein [Alphaproteobacteria bacterium]